MTTPSTTFTGPLGSTIHVLRADAETIERLAEIDWSRHFRRATLDPVRGLISLMSPSNLHEGVADALDSIIEEAADVLGRASKGLRSTRYRRKVEPPGTGLEPDCSFLIGETVHRFIAALKISQAAADEFVLETPPDLVVEVELTHAEAGKPERYGQLGVSELWLLKPNRNRQIIGAEFLALDPSEPPQSIHVSRVLPGILPEQVVQAIEGVRTAPTRAERSEAVMRVIGKRGALRVQEEASAHY